MKTTLFAFPLAIALLAAPHASFADEAAPAAAATSPASSAPDLGRNAALVYWQAFDVLATHMKDEAFLKAVGDYSTVAIDEKVRTFLRESIPIQLTAIAVKIDRCDWGMEMLAKEMGPYALMPHLSKLRELARLVLLDARIKLADKQGAKAADNILAVYQMARHSQAGDVLISHLVAIALEAVANQFLADHLGSFADADLSSLRDRIAALPPLTHPKDAILAEGRIFGGWMKREVQRLKDPKARKQLIALMGLESQLQALQLMLTPGEKLTTMVDELIVTYDEFAKTLTLPPGEFTKAHDVLMEKARQSSNPLAQTMLPALGSVHGTYHRSLALKEMTRALITWRLEGRAKFDAIKDPYGDGSFGVTTTAEGMEISSKLKVRDQPVVMKVKWKPQP